MLCTEYHSTATFTPASHKQIPLHQHHSSPSNFIQMKHKHCGTDNVIFDHRVHKEWQLPLSSVHSIMMENLAQPGEGGGARTPPFTKSTVMYKVVVYAQAERTDTLPLFLLYLYIYSVILITEKGYTHIQWVGVQIKKEREIDKESG
jgi:hypothetical protein